MNSLAAVLAAPAGLVLMALAIAVRVAEAQVLARRAADDPADPARLDLVHEPAVFDSRDGMRLGGRFVAGAEPVRGTVIFCHGHAGSLDGDLKQVPAFQRRGYNVLQFDLRAHGRSEGQAGSMGYIDQISPRPLLLIHGEQDRTVPLREIEALYETAGNPKALGIVPRAGHRQAHQLYLEEYNSRVLGFFDRWVAEGEQGGQVVGG